VTGSYPSGWQQSEACEHGDPKRHGGGDGEGGGGDGEGGGGEGESGDGEGSTGIQ
jgi:hypothetical protein